MLNSSTNNNNNNRPPSRCSSPYSARPGLQEDGESDSLSVLGRSPGRAFETMNAATSTAIPSQHHTISNIHSGGMSSQQSHRRIHSGGGTIDIDKISKPVPPRTHSRSPMRRPSPIDDDDVGNRQPIIPRAFSASPRGRSAATLQYTTNTNNTNDPIAMPDLSMPNFSSPNVTMGLGEKAPTMFTPKPRVIPPSWPSSNNNHDDDDGVTFANPLVPGTTTTIDVRVTSSGPVVLNAWIDFNGDGNWSDAGEHFAKDTTVSPGLNSISVSVPVWAIPGTTFSRFRLSTTGGLEVTEDFLVSGFRFRFFSGGEEVFRTFQQ